MQTTRQAPNPFLPLDEYIPDGEPHVFGDRVYLFGSHDQEGGQRYCSLENYIGWSAPVDDLTDWRCDGVIYESRQDPRCRPGKSDLYAPDVVRGNDGRYYLYYTLSGPSGDGFDGPMCVAVCDSPTGRYEFYGTLCNPDGSSYNRYLLADPAVINDEGVIRLYYGWSLSSAAAAAHGREDADSNISLREFPRERLIQIEMMLFKKSREELELEAHDIMGANHVVLGDDMVTVISEPTRIVPGECDSFGTSFEGHAFYEASSIRKIGDTYYFIYSSQWSAELCYATSKAPDHDFEFQGTIISLGDVGFEGRAPGDRLNMTGNNHGSIENVNGVWYVFYHRQTHNSTYSRQACAEPIEIDQDGRIQQVECTTSGLTNGPLAPVGEFPAVRACSITNGHMPHATNRVVDADIPFVTHQAGERFITNIKSGTTVSFKHFLFTGGPLKLVLKTRGNGIGAFAVCVDEHSLGTIGVSPSTEWMATDSALEAEGVSTLSLRYEGTGAVDLLSVAFVE